MATFVKVLILHIGYFIENDERTYVGSNVDVFDAVDVDKLSVLEISYMLKEFGVFYYKHIFYRIPNKNLVLGLRVLANDDDIREMYSLLENTNTLELFIEHHKPHNVDIAHPVLFLTDVPMKDVKNDGNYNNDHCQEDSNTDSDGNDDPLDRDFSDSSDDDDPDLDDIMFDSNVERHVNEEGLKEGHECKVNDADSSEEELVTPTGFNNEDNNNRPKYPEFRPEVDMQNIEFKLGMLCSTTNEFKDDVKEYAVK
ncbi:hypothetical protein ACSBR1_000920 [Camellia fascicularis]